MPPHSARVAPPSKRRSPKCRTPGRKRGTAGVCSLPGLARRWSSAIGKCWSITRRRTGCQNFPRRASRICKASNAPSAGSSRTRSVGRLGSQLRSASSLLGSPVRKTPACQGSVGCLLSIGNASRSQAPTLSQSRLAGRRFAAEISMSGRSYDGALMRRASSAARLDLPTPLTPVSKATVSGCQFSLRLLQGFLGYQPKLPLPQPWFSQPCRACMARPWSVHERTANQPGGGPLSSTVEPLADAGSIHVSPMAPSSDGLTGFNTAASGLPSTKNVARSARNQIPKVAKAQKSRGIHAGWLWTH